MKSKFNIDSYHKIFKNNVIKYFDFLVKKFNFKITKEEKEPYIFSCKITYQNKTTAVEVSYDVREEGISVFICRLMDGKIPDYEIFINQDTKINRYSADHLISIRSPNPDKEFPNIYHVKIFPPIYDDQTIEKIIKEYARAIQKYALDIMQGNFSIFTKLEGDFKKHGGESVVTYYLPHRGYNKRNKEKTVIEEYKKKIGMAVKSRIKYYKSKET